MPFLFELLSLCGLYVIKLSLLQLEVGMLSKLLFSEPFGSALSKDEQFGRDRRLYAYFPCYIARPDTRRTYNLGYMPQTTAQGVLQPCQLQDGHFFMNVLAHVYFPTLERSSIFLGAVKSFFRVVYFNKIREVAPRLVFLCLSSTTYHNGSSPFPAIA